MENNILKIELKECSINELVESIKLLRSELNGRIKPKEVERVSNIRNVESALPLIFNFMESSYGFTEFQLRGKNRSGGLTRMRHLLIRALYINGEVTCINLGRMFGNRDHTTILNSKTKAYNLLIMEEYYKEEYKNIDEAVKGFLQF